MVILPKEHPIFLSDNQINRRHGQVQQSSMSHLLFAFSHSDTVRLIAEERVTKVMHASMPNIQQFITARVTPRAELLQGVRRRRVVAPVDLVAPPVQAAQPYLSA